MAYTKLYIAADAMVTSVTTHTQLENECLGPDCRHPRHPDSMLCLRHLRMAELLMVAEFAKRVPH